MTQDTSQQNNATAIAIFSLIGAVLLPISIIQFQFPFMGIALSIIYCVVAALFFKQNRSGETYVLSSALLIFAFLSVFRTNPVLLILVYLFTVYAVSLLYSNLSDKYRPYLLPILPFLVFLQPLFQTRNIKPSYQSGLSGYEGYSKIFGFLTRRLKKSNKTDNSNDLTGSKNPGDASTESSPQFDIALLTIGRVIVSICISLVLFIVLSLILASTNKIFSSFFSSFFENLSDLLIWMGTAFNFISPLTAFRLPLTIILAFYLPKLLLSIGSGYHNLNKLNDVDNRETSHNLVNFDIPSDKIIKYLVPKITIAALLALFVITQIQLYTASLDGLIALGLTASERVNEVFGQLSWAIIIVLGLLFFDVAKSKTAKTVSYVLIGLVIAIIGFALYSDLYYINGFGLSLKRIWGLAIVAWLVVLTTIITLKNISNINHKLVVKMGALSTFLVLGVCGIVNFDAQIYNYNQPTFNTNYSFDAVPAYSTDSGNFVSVLELHKNYLEKNNFNPTATYQSNDQIYKVNSNYETMNRYGNSLKQKYCDKPINLFSFNAREYTTAQSLCNTEFDLAND